MTDVIHNPLTDWCACEPHAMNRCDYRRLADAVIVALNPHDGDEAEVSLCIDAVKYIAAYVGTLPCMCSPGDDEGPCARCAVLGQWHRNPVAH